MHDILLNDDLLIKLIKYLDSRQSAYLIRINKSYRVKLDRDWFRIMIYGKKTGEEMQELIVSTGGNDNNIKVYDIDGMCLKTFRGHTDKVLSAAFNAQGFLVVSASLDNTIRIWDMKTCECLRVLKGHLYFVLSAAFDNESSMVVSASLDDTVRIWDAQSGECLKVLKGHTGPVDSAAFNNDGSLIVSASDDAIIRIWETKTGQCLRVLRGHTRKVFSAVFNEQGSLIVSASLDDTIRIWDAQSGVCLKILKDHTDYVKSASFNISGSLIVSASRDKTIRIWDAYSGECLRVLLHNTSIVSWASFNYTGSLIVSASDDGIRLWDVQSGVCLKVIPATSIKASFKRNPLHPTVDNSILNKVEFIKRNGDNLFKNKLVTQAILKYLESLALFKDDTSIPAIEKRESINLNIAFCYTKLGNYNESLLYAEKVITLDRSNTKAQCIICESLYNLRRLKEASERVNKFITKDPGNNDLKKIRYRIRELLKIYR